MVNQEEPTQTTRTVVLKPVQLPETVTVGILAEKLGADSVQVIKLLMRAGIFASVNDPIDFETAATVARPLGYSAKKISATYKPKDIEISLDDTAEAVPRPPVVTILGHVDHGKTSLLDTIRKTSIADRETGGITQHIGAYQVEYGSETLTFIDTPGHEAFTAMRARGAQSTDIAILVIAADDGIMPQTSEAIDHIKAANVPMIVAINKIDVPDSDPERVRRQLSEREVLVEKWGGDILDVEVSAKTGAGLEDLLQSIQLVAEISELKANPDRLAIGSVVEAKLDKSRGPVATILIQTGTLRVGETIVVGTSKGKVKALIDSNGARVDKAGPSMPVEVLGINELPNAGDRLTTVNDDRSAREVIAERIRFNEEKKGGSLQELSTRASLMGNALNIVLKTDVDGSVDAVQKLLGEIKTDEASVRVIHSAPGTVTESDVLLAAASEAIILSFNTRTEPGAKRLAEQDGIEIRNYSIIYRLAEDIEKALMGMGEPTLRDVVEGSLEVRAVFALSRGRNSAGCFVSSGQVSRGSMARVMRDGVEIFDGPISSLRRFKDDVRQVAQGYECGLRVDGFAEFIEGDIIESHRQESS